MAVTYETPELKAACEAEDAILNKITEIKLSDCSGYGTPGPRSEATNARHHHITKSTGIAWKCDGTNIHILALGKKYDAVRGSDDSSYKWSKKGVI